ncbi:MAG: DNA cytosine methyltransferase [Candidatus Omnitrophota bacterium]
MRNQYNKKATSAVAVDLFCGVGGLTHGLIKSGIAVSAGVDLDESCKFAYEKNNDAKFIAKNIKDFTATELNALYGSANLKILVGCAPCQPFSKHTQKNKERDQDEKWGLLYHFLKLVKELKPTIISMENVPQLAKYKVFEDFVCGIKDEGYFVSWKSVFCPDYGIPQNRTRLVLLASKLGKIELLPATRKRENYKTVADTIGKLELIDAGTISRNDFLHRSATLTQINLKRIRKSKPGGSWKDWEEGLRAQCHQKESGETYSSVYSRMRWDCPSPTITTQFYSFGTGRFGHPEQDRALSLREGAMLQTFPRKYKFWDRKTPFSFRKIGVYIGNAVPVRLGEIIGRSIIRHMKEYHG